VNKEVKIDDKLPSKFSRMLLENEEVKEIWQGKSDDRSKADFRLGHLLFANGFKKEEAASVLVNTAKALARAPVHRLSYAMNIIDKIWTYEDTSNKVKLYEDVEDILARNPAEDTGKKFKCHPLIDGVNSGFSLGQVLGLVGGAGAGKTTFSMNFFKWFVERNPDYVHFYVTLEQPVDEIAKRWRTLCQDNTSLHRKVKILGNYNQDGTYRNLSLMDIRLALKEFEAETGSKVGCVVLDHIGILNKNLKNGETQGLIEICQNLKSFAIETNTFFIIQSQTTREKAGIGDLELNKDAAFGTTTFEWYVDFLMTIWQPLKRVYDVAPNMTVMAFKYCKIRHKNVKLDKVKEDQRYLLMFDPMNENLRSLTKDEKTSFEFFNNRATSLRKQDRKTDVLEYKTTDWTKE
jgi:ABC-type dipeptide/oligopeptide/nickel transport system ATPase component